MIPLPFSVQGIAIGVLVIGFGAYALHCEHVKRDRASFIAKLESNALAQKKENERIEKADKERKERADAERKRLLAHNAALAKRLRERPGAGTVPAAPASSGRPDLACFDRAEYQRAYGELVAEVRGGADEGSTCTVELDVVKGWAQSQ